MNTFAKSSPLHFHWTGLTCALVLAAAAGPARAQLLDHLQELALDGRLSAGDPQRTPPFGTDGPKSLVTADFDRDGKADLAIANKDGTVTVYYGRGDAKSEFDGPIHLRGTTNELRGLVAADFHGAGRADLVVVSPVEGKGILFRNLGARRWGSPQKFATWPGARDVVSGDFDGDGRADLVVAGSTNGLRHYQGLGGGAFEVVTNLTNSAASGFDSLRPSQPAFYLRAFREPGSNRDELIVGRADSGHGALAEAQVYGAETSPALEFRGAVSNLTFNALDVGPIFTPASNGVPDLICTDNGSGTVVVRRGVPLAPERFAHTNDIFLCPGGGVRAVRLADFNGDGWNDAAVVQSAFNRVVVFTNGHGSLSEWQILHTGYRPREMVVGEFNGDTRPDLAVLNRDSQDVSIPTSVADGGGGFSSLDGLYPVEGEVVGLEVRDLNGDRRDDVIQLHRASGELSVRLAGTNGVLRDAVSYPMGERPSALVLHDVNRDGKLDALAACLGSTVAVRLGASDGTFGPAITNTLPVAHWGGLYALFPADFDRDGLIDIAAGYYDCRLALFQGDGTGRFELRSVQSFAYESHALTAEDFDRDGDLDVVAFGYNEEVVVLENRGDLLQSTNFHKVITRVPGSFGAEFARAGDFNSDGKPDLLYGGGSGVRIVYGLGNLTFATNGARLSDVSASSYALVDADGDGTNDLVLGCSGPPCLIVLKGGGRGGFSTAFRVRVPSSALVAAGDLDADGKPDLIGTGEVLWTALSSRAPERVPAPGPSTNTNAVPPRIVINELLAANRGLPLAADDGRDSDWVEIFNGSSSATDITDWQVQLVRTNSASTNGNVAGEVVTQAFVFPPGTVVNRGAHLVVVCSDTEGTALRTGFTLPAEPAVLCLFDAAGNLIDRVAYPAQDNNTSYGRYRDGLPGFAASSNPSPGLPNVDDGPISPSVALEGVDTSTLKTNTPIRFFARASDDVGVRNVSLIWRRLDRRDTVNHRVILYDDGMNGSDQVFGDGLFTGRLEPGLPAGATIQFYLECTDLSGQVNTSPGEPVFAAAGRLTTLNAIAIPAVRPALEISEIVADNQTGLRDERGGRPDWIEVRNTSTRAVSLAGLQLSQKFLGQGQRFSFPRNRTLAPGEHLVLYADGDTDQGPLHLPFNLDRDGGEVWLHGTTATGARSFVDTVKFGALTNDVAWSRLGVGGPWRVATPTPSRPNLTTPWIGLAQTNGTFTFGYATTRGVRYTVETTDAIRPTAWKAVSTVTGNGAEQSITQPMVPKRFYRVRRNR